eukprot:363913-Chlamydomonas_euryale.AAC.17
MRRMLTNVEALGVSVPQRRGQGSPAKQMSEYGLNNIKNASMLSHDKPERAMRPQGQNDRARDAQR